VEVQLPEEASIPCDTFVMHLRFSIISAGAAPHIPHANGFEIAKSIKKQSHKVTQDTTASERWRHTKATGVYSSVLGRGNPKTKSPLGRPRCRWHGNIKTDLKEIGHQGVDWTQVAQVGPSEMLL
jgi:hypothetical protein